MTEIPTNEAGLPVVFALAVAGAEAACRVRAVDVVEELSGRFAAWIDLEQLEDAFDPDQLLGASATLVVSRPALPGERAFAGIIRQVVEVAVARRSSRRCCR